MTSRFEDDIEFPYKRFSSMEEPEVYFERARKYRPLITEEVPRDGMRLLKPRGVVSRTSTQDFLKHFFLYYIGEKNKIPVGRKVVIIKSPKGTYDRINILTDYFTENARVRDFGAHEVVSPYEYWSANRKTILSRAKNQHEARELLWKEGPKEARQGKITNYLSIFEFLGSEVILDPSAAWGDRLIAALAAPRVVAYTGVDPHRRLPAGWDEILTKLGPLSGKDLERFKMINEPFEPKDGTPLPEDHRYDTVLISTAPLIGDKYDVGNEQQATEKHGDSLTSYFKGFLVPYLQRSISVLKRGGYLAVTVLDRSEEQYYVTELKLLLIESYGMTYQGVIWWEGDSGGLVPWWMFKKTGSSMGPKRYEEWQKLYSKYSDIFPESAISEPEDQDSESE
jgi:hypothetical protein